MNRASKISVIYITGRDVPHVEWSIASLAAQMQAHDEIEFLIIDAQHRPLTRLLPAHEMPVIDRGVLNVRAIGCKPNSWNGPYRKTPDNWWGIAAARNTGIVCAEHDYIAFSDDRCRFGSDWLRVVREGSRTRDRVIAGSYTKNADGKVSVDHRLEAAPRGRVNCGGGWLYGCTSALPLAWALDVNGFEEGCDGMGLEDVIFGLMLERQKRPISFVSEMRIDQDRSLAEIGPLYRRTDKGVSPNDKSHAALARFGQRATTELTPSLKALRQRIRHGDPWPLPTIDLDWYDQQPLSAMSVA